MAKFGTYYGLCPLIDTKNLLGLCEDVKNGTVIVTLGKNIAIKYKLSDQKQLQSWRTREKYTSPVIYDKFQTKYAAVFNYSYIRLWTDEDEHLDKLKKFKFNQPITTIFSCNGEHYLLFKNGSIVEINQALSSRKTLITDDVIHENDIVQDILYKTFDNTLFVGLITKLENTYFCYWIHGHTKRCKTIKIGLERKNCILSGSVFHMDQQCISLLTIWSDGRIFSLPLTEKECMKELRTPGKLFAVIESLSTKQKVSMISLDDNYIAMYGADCNEEGAVLIIYNTQFKVTQSKQPFKMFTSDSNLWRIENYLFLPVGQNLAVVPFYLDSEQLAALIGSHKTCESEVDPDVTILQELDVVNWNTGVNVKPASIPIALHEKILPLIKQGSPENTIFYELLTFLMEKLDFDLISSCIDYFCDISEENITKMLKFMLNVNSELFLEISRNDSIYFPPEMQPLRKSNIIDKILAKSYHDILLLPFLRNYLDINEVLLLLNYIYFMLSEDGHCLPNMNNIETESKLLNWTCVLLDSSYQKILMVRDEKSCTLLKNFQSWLNTELDCLVNLRQLEPVLNIYKKENYNCKSNTSSLKYSVDQLCLY